MFKFDEDTKVLAGIIGAAVLFAVVALPIIGNAGSMIADVIKLFIC